MGTEKQQNNKLDLKLNESVRVKLLRDKAYEGNSAYGPYYLYAVDDNGVEKSFFAPEEIHQQIVGHGLKSGSEFTLKKVAAQNGKKISGQLVFEALNAQPTTAAPTQQDVSADDFKELMRQSIADAVDIAATVPGIDVQRIGTAIFIARTKSNGFT